MGPLKSICCFLPVNCSMNTFSPPWGARTQRMARGCQLHSDLELGLQRSSCLLSHWFKITGAQQLKPVPVICSEQVHKQFFCSSLELACLPMAWAMWGYIKSPASISRLGCLTISIRATFPKPANSLVDFFWLFSLVPLKWLSWVTQDH